MRKWLNETLVPDFNAGIDNAIAEFQKGIENAETRVVESEAAHTLLVNNALAYINTNVADLTNFINTEIAESHAYVDNETASARQYVDDSVQFINNKTGQAQIQRATLTGPHTVNIDPLWPNNHPIDIVLTQDATGGRTVALGASITGTVNIDSQPNGVTEFKLVPSGDGTWHVEQPDFPWNVREMPGNVDTRFEPGDARRYKWETDIPGATAAIRKLITDIGPASRITNTVRIVDNIITIPAGTWTVTEIGALLKGVPSDGRRHRGLIIQGMGRDTTTIVFDPSEDGYLIDNQDRMSRITIRDITFVGGSTKASFMNSVSNGGPKSLVVERITFNGTWKYGFNLTGTDTNSEFIFYGIKANGYYDTFFRCDNVQALNHHFIGCDMELSNGATLDYINGGHINIIGGSWINNINNTLLDGGGTFIKLGTPGGTSGAAVSRFYMEGVRIEQRSLTTKLIDSYWSSGTITFKSVHDVGYQGETLATNQGIVRASFRGTHPVITFENCRLSGKHEYITTSSEDQARRLVTYRDCIIEHFESFDQFIVNTNTGGRPAAVVPVRFEHCRPGSALTSLSTGAVVWDQLVNGLISKNAVLKKHIISLKNFSGGLPGTGTTIPITLPVGAILTSIRAFAPAGATSAVSTTWSYAVVDGDSSTITTIQGSTAQNLGFDIKNDVMIPLTTDNKRKLVVTPGASTGGTNTTGFILLEYLS